jgi:hypothetical protein
MMLLWRAQMNAMHGPATKTFIAQSTGVCAYTFCHFALARTRDKVDKPDFSAGIDI